MAFPSWTSSGGIKISTTVVAANVSGRAYKDVIVQNQSSTAAMYIKHGLGASSTDFDYKISAGGDPVRLPSIPDSDIYSAASTDLQYTVAYR